MLVIAALLTRCMDSRESPEKLQTECTNFLESTEPLPIEGREPPESSEIPQTECVDATEPAQTTAETEDPMKMAQILPMENGAVAVLYTDGTVTVAGNPLFADAVSEWRDVSSLCHTFFTYDDDAPSLVGLTREGAVLTTVGTAPDWHDVYELHLIYGGMIGVTKDGTVLAHNLRSDAPPLEGLTDVETLVLSPIGGWACLKKDGSVFYPDSDRYPEGEGWKNVKELRSTDHSHYAIMQDGTVEGTIDDTYVGLTTDGKLVGDGAYENTDFSVFQS